MIKQNPMIIMMRLFIKSLAKYGNTLSKQNAWLKKYVRKSGYSINQNPMFSTNLKLWLSEAEDTFGSRICPCFSPTGDKIRDSKMTCPCKYIDQDIKEKGTCHCTLFAAGNAGKDTYRKAMSRLMKEYQIPMLRNQQGEIDIRNYPMDEIRGLRVPDAYHLIKRAVIMQKGPVKMFVEHDYEVEAIRMWGNKNGHRFEVMDKEDGYSLTVSS